MEGGGLRVKNEGWRHLKQIQVIDEVDLRMHIGDVVFVEGQYTSKYKE